MQVCGSATFGSRALHLSWTRRRTEYEVRRRIFFYYIDTDEIRLRAVPLQSVESNLGSRVFPFTKKIISPSGAVKVLFLSFTCEDIGVAMVTNINFDFLEQKI